jgi:NlpC/P60 family putative phage cell wall peptidase
MTPEALARGWVGTPYRHQASCRNAGADCLGLIRGIWRDLYGQEPVGPVIYSSDWAEVRQDEPLLVGLSGVMVPRLSGGLSCGEVVLFRMHVRAAAKHLGVIVQAGPEWRFVHACVGVGVVETSLSSVWQRRIVARFAFP